MFLVGDAPPHMDYAQDTKYPEVLRMARDRGIIVNAVQAGGARDTERVWRDIAQMGHGRYIPIPQDGGHLVVIETPYDSEIIELQDDINGTVIPYGPRRAAQRRRAEDQAGRRRAARRSPPKWPATCRATRRERPARPSPAPAIWSPTSRPAGRSSTP